MTVYIIITMVRLVDSIGAWIESMGIGHRGAKRAIYSTCLQIGAEKI